MNTTTTNFTKKYLLILMLFVSMLAVAQPGFDDGTGVDEPVAPINEWIYLIGGLGIVYALYRFKNKAVN